MKPPDVEVRAPVAMLSAASHRAEVTTGIDEAERAGQPVLLVCLDRAPHHHDATRADVLHVPLLSAGILSSLVIRLARDPGRVLRVLLRLLGGVTTPRLAASTLLRFPAAVHLAQLLPRRGVIDIQGIDPVASKVAGVARELSDLTPPDLAELPVEWARIGARRIGVRWLSRRINSIAAEVSLDEGEERVIVKRQRDHAGGSAADRWAHESRVLGALGEAMGDGAFTVPRVLLFDEEATLLVMERARGTALDALFAAAAADRFTMTRLAEGIRGAGAWLAAMQAATPSTADGRALLARLGSVAGQDAAKLAATDAVMRRHHARMVRQLEAMERRLSARHLTVAGHHDDYWPGNVFFDGDRVTVIDFESFRDGLLLEDAAFFLLRCDLLRRRFRLRFPDLARRFFDGYCPGQEPDREALRFFTVTKGLRALAKGAGEDLPSPQRIWTRRTIRNAVLDAVRDQP